MDDVLRERPLIRHGIRAGERHIARGLAGEFAEFCVLHHLIWRHVDRVRQFLRGLRHLGEFGVDVQYLAAGGANERRRHVSNFARYLRRSREHVRRRCKRATRNCLPCRSFRAEFLIQIGATRDCVDRIPRLSLYFTRANVDRCARCELRREARANAARQVAADSTADTRNDGLRYVGRCVQVGVQPFGECV